MTTIVFESCTIPLALLVPAKGRGEPITATGLSSCLDWLSDQKRYLHDQACARPDASLLTVGIRQGRLMTANCSDDGGEHNISFTVPGRDARLVSPSQFLIVRLLALPGRKCEWWFDRATRKDLPDYEQRLYLRYGRVKSGIQALRIFADAKLDEAVFQRVKTASPEHWGHKDLRPRNFEIRSRTAVAAEGKKMRSSYMGRKEAIELAVTTFGTGQDHLSITAEDYRQLLQDSFDVFDASHAEDFERVRPRITSPLAVNRPSKD